MTTPDAGQRLIEDLRRSAAEICREGYNGWGNVCSDAADELERLRGVEDDARRYRWLQENFVTFLDEHGNHLCLGIYGENLDVAIDAAIAASRSTGAADVRENHG